MTTRHHRHPPRLTRDPIVRRGPSPAGWSPSSASRSAGSPPAPRRTRRQPRPAAVVGGLLTGAVLGAVQAWGTGHRQAPDLAWIVGHRHRPDGRSRARRLAGRLPHQPRRPRSSRAPCPAPPSAWPRPSCFAAARPARPRLARLPRRGLGARLGRSPPPSASRSTSSSPSSARAAPRGHRAHLGPAPRPRAPPPPRAERVMTRHVVFGTGQVGRPVIEQLVAARPRRRRRQPQRPGRLRRRPGRRRRRHRPGLHHSRQRRRRRRLLLPQRQRTTPAGRRSSRPCSAACSPAPRRPAPASSCSTTSTAYGPPDGRRPGRDHGGRPDVDEVGDPGGHDRRAAARPTAAGRVEVAIGRASDYFGPGATRSPPSARPSSVGALTGKTAQVMGDPDQLHSYSYTPDVAAGLITLGTAPGGDRPDLAPPGRPTPAPPARSSTTSTRSPATGHALLAAGRTTLRAARHGQAGDARIPPHALPVHRPLGRRRHASSAPPSATTPPRSTRPSPPPSHWYRDRTRAAPVH